MKRKHKPMSVRSKCALTRELLHAIAKSREEFPDEPNRREHYVLGWILETAGLNSYDIRRPTIIDENNGGDNAKS